MRRDEAQKFIDEEMRSRWPHWESTPAQITDWVSWLMPYGWDAAKSAMRRYISDAKYGREPDPGRLMATLRAYAPAVGDTRNDEGDPAVTLHRMWIVYMGGGKGTLQPGYFTAAPSTPERRAELVKRLKSVYTGDEGEWLIMENTTAREMIDARFEMRGHKPPLPGENWRDYADRIGVIPQPKSANVLVQELLVAERASV
jgi:hypothetical protein